MVVIGQKWFYSGISGCIRAKVIVLGQGSFIRAKVVGFEQKWLFSCENGSIRAKVVVIG